MRNTNSIIAAMACISLSSCANFASEWGAESVSTRPGIEAEITGHYRAGNRISFTYQVKNQTGKKICFLSGDDGFPNTLARVFRRSDGLELDPSDLGHFGNSVIFGSFLEVVPGEAINGKHHLSISEYPNRFVRKKSHFIPPDFQRDTFAAHIGFIATDCNPASDQRKLTFSRNFGASTIFSEHPEVFKF